MLREGVSKKEGERREYSIWATHFRFSFSSDLALPLYFFQLLPDFVTSTTQCLQS